MVDIRFFPQNLGLYMGLGYGPRVWDQGSAEDFLSGVVIFLPPQVNSLPPHLFSHLTCGGKEFTWGEELAYFQYFWRASK